MTVRPSALALTPLLLFLALFFGAGLYYTSQGDAMGFYQLRAPVAILPALALGAWLAHRRGVAASPTLLGGMGDANVMLMCLIFLLAGAFATVSKAIGAVDAVVALGLGALPPSLILPGLFLVASFVSLAIGTSMGTIAAVVPIALGVADAAGLDRTLVVGAVIGGAMFGDNLSVISDTTIAATRSQGAEMRDKFRENFKIALPAALATAVLLAFLGEGAPVEAPGGASPWLVLPYVLVLVLALIGLDVVVVLAIGLALSGVFGFVFAGDYTPVDLAGDIYAGFESMVEVTLLSILIGGLGALMKASGGLDWLARTIARFARGHTGRRSGEFSIAALSAGTDVLTANNTVAILITGSLAKDIAERHGITPRRSASLLDIFACVVQGVLPYGAQILLASSLAAVSPLALAGSVHYCWLLVAAAVVFMLLPARRSTAVAGTG
ncbi:MULTISPECIES: Na+/H+ antiporter NhaC family protein [Pseudoxanthomonas]|jgi:Na+/H+ antiporter NhaC|uniref:Na+/H+ antiporter NhaC family protein n=1 Tax=Pseudoxanthomonas TaxID=83618 RepID=UPI00161AFB33|nr:MULTISPECIES: Na+/H+ antiporter NhaC family protein [Pseudoxanthomonas]MBB3274896.1 Na+/H+ antiporter NhaC [Pseudoxanthomonas sp. OG2]MBD9378272.1 Na+/H+ antiporter NhaC family protein [Pseudoxanthomonas sp. PXM04]MBV7475212.1 Na+/H+ antiporter NhaC family protein [Pseudoxanthomonas sp. PXM05]UBB23829.1 Na+/H+ antiporter NhaC family protein [Pseudoxanthomonas japonensis]